MAQRRKSVRIRKTKYSLIVPEIEQGEGEIAINVLDEEKELERAILMTERRLMASGFGFVGYIIRVKNEMTGESEVVKDFKP